MNGICRMIRGLSDGNRLINSLEFGKLQTRPYSVLRDKINVRKGGLLQSLSRFRGPLAAIVSSCKAHAFESYFCIQESAETNFRLILISAYARGHCWLAN